MQNVYLLACTLVQGRAGSLGGAEPSFRTPYLEFASSSIPEGRSVGLFCGPCDLGKALELSWRRRPLSEADTSPPYIVYERCATPCLVLC